MCTPGIRLHVLVLLAVLAVTAGCTGRVGNPDYQGWSAFDPGATVTLEGHQSIDGEKRPVRVTATLIAKDHRQIVVERRYVYPDAPAEERTRADREVEFRTISAVDHLLTHPAAKRVVEQRAEVEIAGRPFACEVVTVTLTADFDGWEERQSGTLHLCPEIPGGLAAVSMRSHTPDQEFEFWGQVVSFDRAGR
jgi:hypothetical protein